MPLLDDGVVEAAETFTLTLAEPSATPRPRWLGPSVAILPLYVALQLLEAAFDDLLPQRWGLAARSCAGVLLVAVYVMMLLSA